MENLIEVNNISKSFDKKKILDNISFTIGRGEIFGILGQSGAGKTVLMKLLIGFYKPDSGDILYNGKSIFHNTSKLMSNIGFASQKHCVYYDLSVKENLKYFGKLYGLSNKTIQERTDKVLELVELSDSKNKVVGKMSGGMQRRLDIACALLHDPEIIIMDEPESGLDPVLRQHIALLIQKIRDEGKTVILSSHFMKEVEPLCDRVAMFKDGILAAYGSPIELLRQFADSYEIILRSYPGDYKKILDVLKKGGLEVLDARMENNRLVISVPQKRQPEVYVKFVVSNLDALHESLLDVQLNNLSLESVFKRIVVK